MSQAKLNDTVQVHYTGKLTNGDQFDSSAGREPLSFTVGSGQVIPGFDQAVLGMALQEKKTITIPFAEAYGPKNPELIQEVPKANFPDHIKPEVGLELMAQQPNGQQLNVKVVELTDTGVVIDGNHPLAGEDLVFEIELVGIG
ncbi:MAG: peptidylprolyl isomerase [Bacteroidota bacterium]